MRRVVGIDWATERKNRALVVIDVVDDGRCIVSHVKPMVDDDAAVQVCLDPTNAVVAVDIPFGWPSQFSEFVSKWKPTTQTVAPPASDTFRLRLTDRVVKKEVPKEPLSVSSDRIAMGARSWANMVAARELWSRIDVVGDLHKGHATLIEV
ncbi:MAG TPA: DUF429 domain-containing protein, partial [Polyangiaceae bacterium]